MLLAYNNRADEAVLSNGAWSTTLPQSNLQDRVQSNVARTANAANSSTIIDIALAKARPIGLIALCNHSISIDGKYRVRGYTDAARTVIAYDGGTIDVWPAIYSTLDLHWQDDTFWSGRVSAEDLIKYRWNLTHRLSSTPYLRYWRIEIFDATNSKGYLDFGRLFIADAWVPILNMNYGSGIGYKARTKIEEALDGTEYFDEYAPFRVATFTLADMSEDEAMGRAFDIQRVVEISREVYFMWDEQDVKHLVRRSFLGRLESLSQIENPYFKSHTTPFTVKELL